MKLLSFKLIIQSTLAILTRFPYVMSSAFLATFLAITWIELRNPPFFIEKLFQLSILLVPLGIAARLLIERNQMKRSSQRYLYTAIGLFCLIYYLASPREASYSIYLRFIILFISFHFFVSFAPFLNHPNTLGFWRYNYTLLVNLLGSLLYSSVFYLGIATALLAIDLLFGIDIPENIYLDLLILSVGIFNTASFLSSFPSHFHGLETIDSYPKDLKLFIEFVLLPLITLYLLILYVYAFKISFEWGLPQGWVSYMVIALSFIGFFSLLLVYPVQDEEDSQWIRTFFRWFYIALLPLICLLFIAISRRVGEYGLTEPRYYVIMIAIWLTGIILYFLLISSERIQWLPISLSLLFFFSSFGNWGAFTMAKNSQMRRFDLIVRRNNLLGEGRILLGSAAGIPQKDLNEIASIIQFLNQRQQIEALQPYFHQDLDSLFKDELSPAAKEAKLLALMSNPESSQNTVGLFANTLINFSIDQKNKTQEIKGYDHLLSLESYSPQGPARIYALGNQKIKIKTNFSENRLLIQDASQENILLDFDLNLTIQNLIESFAEAPQYIPPQEMTLIEESRRYRAKLQIQELKIRRINKIENRCEGISGQIFVRFF